MYDSGNDLPAPRAPGMTLLRMPVFCWTMLVTCLMVVTSFPALVAAMAC